VASSLQVIVDQTLEAEEKANKRVCESNAVTGSLQIVQTTTIANTAADALPIPRNYWMSFRLLVRGI